MDKINFENLPSTNTPINAENLNQMQDNIEQAFTLDYITAKLSESTPGITNAEVIAPLNTILYSKGNTFSLQADGGIKINKDCNIEINATLRFGYSEVSIKQTFIYKNSERIANLSQQNMTATTQSLSAIYLPVKANDIIYLKAKSDLDCTFVSSGTFLSLKVLPN